MLKAMKSAISPASSLPWMVCTASLLRNLPPEINDSNFSFSSRVSACNSTALPGSEASSATSARRKSVRV